MEFYRCLLVPSDLCYYLDQMFLLIFCQNVLSIGESGVLKSSTIIMLQLMCGFTSSSCFTELCGPMLGAWSNLALFAVGKKTDQSQLAGGKGYFRRSVEGGWKRKPRECCFLACSLLLARSAFLYFPRPRKDRNIQFLRLYIKVCFLSLKLTLKAEIWIPVKLEKSESWTV